MMPETTYLEPHRGLITRRGSIKKAAVITGAEAVSPSFLFAGNRICAKPFVKWAGGKRQLLEHLDALLPSDFSEYENLTYVEPFVGGGAMLFHVLSKYPNIRHAVINDLNSNLIASYRIIKERPDDLILALHELQKAYWCCANKFERKQLYLAKRERYNSRNLEAVENAALFIFLNRTCFNGLYRVNSSGEFNVPFGKAINSQICNEEALRIDSELLQKVEILCGDFEEVEKSVKGRAFFYFDPPYRPLSKTAAFTAYTKEGFGDDQQKRLSEFCRRLDAGGHKWLLSNSDPRNSDPDDHFFDDLYAGFDINRVLASRTINHKRDGRGKITELAIRNYSI